MLRPGASKEGSFDAKNIDSDPEIPISGCWGRPVAHLPDMQGSISSFLTSIVESL